MENLDGTLFYNDLQDAAVSKLIIDSRFKNEYQDSYIKTAINVPIDSELMTAYIANKLTVNEFIHKIEETCLEKFKKEFNKRHMKAIYRKIIIYDDIGSTNGPASILAKAIIEQANTNTVFTIEDGFKNFQNKYPFLCSSEEKKALSGFFPSEIIPDFLYLGNYQNASSELQLGHLKISHVINAAGELPNYFQDKLQYFNVAIDDIPTANISTAFIQTFEFIEKARISNGRVLIHCNMGMSRSSSVTIAYLMKINRWPFKDAERFVKQRRSVINPNPGFRIQLQEFEVMLLK